MKVGRLYIEGLLLLVPAIMFAKHFWLIGLIGLLSLLCAWHFKLFFNVFNFDGKLIQRIIIFSVAGVVIGMLKYVSDGWYALGIITFVFAGIIYIHPVSVAYRTIGSDSKN